MDELQIGDKTEHLGTVLMKLNTRQGLIPVFSNENKYSEKCVDLEKSEPVLDNSLMEEDFKTCLMKFEWVQDCWGNRIDDNDIINCILFEARTEEYEEVVMRILSYEALLHEQVTVGDVKKIIEKVREDK